MSSRLNFRLFMTYLAPQNTRLGVFGAGCRPAPPMRDPEADRRGSFTRWRNEVQIFEDGALSPRIGSGSRKQRRIARPHSCADDQD